MDHLSAVWQFCVHHWFDIVLAVVFAFFFAIVIDYWQPASRLRKAVRRFKNYLAEGSAKRLQQRIDAQERYRSTIASYLASDKSHYLLAYNLFCLCCCLYAWGR